MTNLNYLEEIARSDAAMDVALLEESAKNWLVLMTAPPGTMFTWARGSTRHVHSNSCCTKTDILSVDYEGVEFNDLPDWW